MDKPKDPAFRLEPGGILKAILKATRRERPAIIEAPVLVEETK